MTGDIYAAHFDVPKTCNHKVVDQGNQVLDELLSHNWNGDGKRSVVKRAVAKIFVVHFFNIMVKEKMARKISFFLPLWRFFSKCSMWLYECLELLLMMYRELPGTLLLPLKRDSLRIRQEIFQDSWLLFSRLAKNLLYNIEYED